MDSNRWQKVENIVDTVLTLSGKKRTEYIEEQCAGDKELKSSVTELLEYIDKSEGYLEEPEYLQEDLLASYASEEVDASSSMVGEQIGPYKIIELIEHGGMGSVFIAERIDADFEQRVALKLIRRGMDTPSNIARFKREQQILANLDHANIAQLYDGGITEDGLPYLVMELVDGTPIDQFCEEQDLSISKRLDLFKSVCHAVQYANTNLIIHRDLKPENILVKENGEIKILDFGIAKLLEPEDTKQTIFQTGSGDRMLTLPYAAPEQIANEPITISTDVYALGILLYRLLTHTHPFVLEGKSISEIEEIICQNNPQKPSNKTDKWNKNLQGDLDAIILKALRKDVEGRYNSAGELADDLNRYQKDLPVGARAETFRYNISKFINRHRQQLAIAAGILLLIIGLVGFYSWRITEEKNLAQLEAQKAEEVTDFLVRIFEGSDPEVAKGDSIPVQHFLETGVDRINEMDGQPKVKAALLSTMGAVYENLGEYEKSKPLHDQAVKISEREYKGPHPDLVKAYVKKGLLETEIGNFSSAETLYIKGIKLLESFEKRPDTLYGKTLSNLGLLYEEQGKPNKAVPIHKKSVALNRQLYPDGHISIAKSLNHLAVSLEKTGDFEGALKAHKEALEILRDQLGENHSQTAITTHNLGLLYRKLGKIDKAIELIEQAFEIKKEIYGDEHLYTASSLAGLGHLYRERGEPEKSIFSFKKAMDIVSNTHGDSSMYAGFVLSGLGRSLQYQGHHQKAEEALRKSKKFVENAVGKNSTHIISVNKFLGDLLLVQEKHPEAQKLYNQSLQLLEEHFDRSHPSYPMLLKSMGKLAIAQDSLTKAQSYLEPSIEFFSQTFPNYHWRLAEARLELGKVFYHLGSYTQSQELLEQNIPYIRELRGKTDPYVIRSQEMLDQLSSVNM